MVFHEGSRSSVSPKSPRVICRQPAASTWLNEQQSSRPARMNSSRVARATVIFPASHMLTADCTTFVDQEPAGWKSIGFSEQIWRRSEIDVVTDEPSPKPATIPAMDVQTVFLELPWSLSEVIIRCLQNRFETSASSSEHGSTLANGVWKSFHAQMNVAIAAEIAATLRAMTSLKKNPAVHGRA